MRYNKVMAAAAALAGVVALAGVAGAHAHLEKSNIRANSVVTTAPANLDLSFTQALKSLKAEVLDVKGASVTAGDAVVNTTDTKLATVPLKPGLPQGAYTVKLTMVAEDGHTSTDRYQFHVTSPSTSDSPRLFWNGTEIKGDVPIVNIDGRNMVSVRAVAEALGKTVEWDPNQRFVIVADAPTAHHKHAKFTQPEGTAAPTAKLHVTADPLGGFNIQVETTNWTWAPEHVNGEAKPNEGHAHLYVDGKKVARLYGPWYNLSGLTPGQHDIRVTLNANDHADYVAADGHAVADTVSVVQGADGKGVVGGDGHGHGHDH